MSTVAARAWARDSRSWAHTLRSLDTPPWRIRPRFGAHKSRTPTADSPEYRRRVQARARRLTAIRPARPERPEGRRPHGTAPACVEFRSVPSAPQPTEAPPARVVRHSRRYSVAEVQPQAAR